ncbi:hypothetical protein OF83DRAFT_1086754 [Amylostereum chailletii]|nr:hypothetical protein OF83DRAFT_1086754 [Amylostereum chailletii]
MVDMTRDCIYELVQRNFTDGAIWRSARHKDILRPTGDFLWKALHNTSRCGEYWRETSKPERVECPSCPGEVESLAHILLECNAPGQSQVWSLAKALWLERHPRWPTIQVGTILGCGLLSIANAPGTEPKPGLSRFLRILLSESAYLIWKMRCSRVIDGTETTTNHVTAKWRFTMNARQDLDRTMTWTRFGPRALRDEVVLATWAGSIRGYGDLPDNWLCGHRALVGSGRPLRDPP